VCSAISIEPEGKDRQLKLTKSIEITENYVPAPAGPTPASPGGGSGNGRRLRRRAGATRSGGGELLHRRPSKTRGVLLTGLRRASVPIGILVLWQIAAAAGLIDTKLMSSPAEVFDAGRELITSGELGEALGVSLLRIAQGLAVGLPLGLALGIVSGLFRLGEELVDATMQALRTVPFVALIPLFILWFGIGESSKIALIAFGVAFPMYLNTYAGIRGVDDRLIEAAEVFGLSRSRLVRQVIVPGALPSILVGLRYSLGLAVIALVVAETVNASSGVGALMANARQFLQTDIVLFGIVIYSVLGLVADFAVRTLERRLLSWRGTFKGA